MAKTEKPKRGIGESFTGNVVYGPRTGFIEDIETNLMLLQNIIPKVELEVLELEVGTVTKTKVVVVGVRNVYDKQVKNAIVKKIEEIEIDGVIDSYYIRGFLQTKAESFFKQVGITEKPDILSRKLLEGRVAVFVDGSPIVLSLPFVLLEDIHASEDYYQEKTIASFLRILRCLGLFVAVIFPALYVSFLIFHYQALPLIFLTTIINQSEYLPLPPAL
ncbi:MAG: spore germination protein, partial [Firmicutes bacterium]|nr:spore germination protein [Bacillota bacterium]